MINKQIDFKTTRNFECIPVGHGFLLVKESCFFNDVLKSETEYIVAESNLDNIQLDGKPVLSGIYAMKKGILEKMQSTPFDWKEYEPFWIEHPFSYAKEQGLDELVFLKINFSCHRVFLLDGKPVPVAIYFDYIQGGIVDGSYDLNKVADYLSKRDDIELLTSKKGAIIQDIPYYNQEEGHSRCVEFVWKPTQTDFHFLCLNTKENFVDRHHDVKSLILKLDEFKIF